MKRFLIISLISLLPTIAFSQAFEGGLLAGFNGSQVEGDLASGYNKLGAVAGAWTQIQLADRWYCGMELKFNQKGSRILPTKKNDYWKYVYRLNYADLPVVLGYQINPSVSVFVGGSFGYLISKSGYNNWGDDPSVEYQNVAPWEIGAIFGTKVDFDQLVRKDWARRMTLDLRIQYSAFSILEPHQTIVGNYQVGQFNNVLSTTLYYRVDFGRASE
jgi:hypothetical protein